MVTYTVTQSVSKADIINKQFHSVYTKNDYTNMPNKGPSPYSSMMKIKVNNQGVVKLIRGLRPFKATGRYEIPAYILKSMADHLAPYLTKLYQISLDRGLVPDESQHCPSLQERREAYSIQLPTSVTDFDRLQTIGAHCP